MSILKVASTELPNIQKMGNDEIIPLYSHVIDHLASRSDDDSVWITTVFSLVEEIKKRKLVPEETVQDMSTRAFKVIVREKEEHEIKDPALIDFLRHQGFPILTLQELSYRVKTSPIHDAIAFLYQLREECGDVKQEGLDLYGKLIFWASNPSHDDCLEANELSYLLLRALLRKEMISDKRYDQEIAKLPDEPAQPSQEAADPFERYIQILSAHTGDASEIITLAQEAFALTDAQKEPLKFFRVYLMTIGLHPLTPEMLGIADQLKNDHSWSWIFSDQNE